MSAIGLFPGRGMIRAWLTAGVFEPGKGFAPTEEGSPQGGVITPPTQWITSASMSRSATGGWSGRGAPRAASDISGSTLMSCLGGDVRPAASTLSGSTPLLSWPGRVSRRQRRRGSWRTGSAARCGRPAGMWSRRRPRAGCRCPRRGVVFTVKLPAAGGSGPGACPGVGADHFRRGRPGAGGIPGQGPQKPSPR